MPPSAVNVPLHWNGDGLPIGVMLAGRMGDEATLISLSAQLEQARPWKDRHPPHLVTTALASAQSARG